MKESADMVKLDLSEDQRYLFFQSLYGPSPNASLIQGATRSLGALCEVWGRKTASLYRRNPWTSALVRDAKLSPTPVLLEAEDSGVLGDGIKLPCASTSRGQCSGKCECIMPWMRSASKRRVASFAWTFGLGQLAQGKQNI